MACPPLAARHSGLLRGYGELTIRIAPRLAEELFARGGAPEDRAEVAGQPPAAIEVDAARRAHPGQVGRDGRLEQVVAAHLGPPARDVERQQLEGAEPAPREVFQQHE